jgi:hypothetical protein
MHDSSAQPTAFWASVVQDVTSRVEPVLAQNDQIQDGQAQDQARDAVIAYLRDLQAVALRRGSSREALQVIASGRRLLGDHAVPPPGEIARALRTALT